MIRVLAAATLAVAGLILGAPEVQAQVVTCAPEGQICRVPARATVYFGVVGRITSIVANGPVACNVATFGRDPAPGARKGCSYVLDGGRDAGGFDRDRRGGPSYSGDGRGRRDRDIEGARRDRDYDDGRRSRREYDEYDRRRPDPRF